MKFRAILFDMDGTLLPMDMKEFSNGYFQFLAKKCECCNLPPIEEFIAAVWRGTYAMVKNDGTVKNRERFWDCFCKETGVSREQMEPLTEDFYAHEFYQGKQFTQENPLAPTAVRIAHEKAPIVALATNPLFPMVGQVSRMDWVGLKPSDFDLITSYETDSYCKPNPRYFETVLERIGCKPEECLLIGNDEREDMFAASSVGISCYLVTDTMISYPDHPWNGPKGSFSELVTMLQELEAWENCPYETLS